MFLTDAFGLTVFRALGFGDSRFRHVYILVLGCSCSAWLPVFGQCRLFQFRVSLFRRPVDHGFGGFVPLWLRCVAVSLVGDGFFYSVSGS